MSVNQVWELIFLLEHTRITQFKTSAKLVNRYRARPFKANI